MTITLYGIQLEEVAARYTYFIKSNIDEALSVVEAWWAAPPLDTGLDPDPLDLPRPGEGDYYPLELPDAESVFDVIDHFPSIAVEASVMRADPNNRTLADVQITVVAYTLHKGDMTIAAKYAYRYLTALASLMWDQKPRGIAETVDMSLDLGPVISDSMQNFVKAARVQQTIKVGAMLSG